MRVTSAIRSDAARVRSPSATVDQLQFEFDAHVSDCEALKSRRPSLIDPLQAGLRNHARSFRAFHGSSSPRRSPAARTPASGLRRSASTITLGSSTALACAPSCGLNCDTGCVSISAIADIGSRPRPVSTPLRQPMPVDGAEQANRHHLAQPCARAPVQAPATPRCKQNAEVDRRRRQRKEQHQAPAPETSPKSPAREAASAVEGPHEGAARQQREQRRQPQRDRRWRTRSTPPQASAMSCAARSRPTNPATRGTMRAPMRRQRERSRRSGSAGCSR